MTKRESIGTTVKKSLILLFLTILMTSNIIHADPPPGPPPCDLVLGPLFCIRMTDIKGDAADSNRYKFEFEFVNWTGTDAAGIKLSLNTARDPGTALDPGEPYIVSASIDADGRPIGVGSNPPTGNLAAQNDWTVTAQDSTAVMYSAGAQAPILHPQSTPVGTNFHGLLDPAFNVASKFECDSAHQEMIPGSIFGFFTPDGVSEDDLILPANTVRVDSKTVAPNDSTNLTVSFSNQLPLSALSDTIGRANGYGRRVLVGGTKYDDSWRTHRRAGTRLVANSEFYSYRQHVS